MNEWFKIGTEFPKYSHLFDNDVSEEEKFENFPVPQPFSRWSVVIETGTYGLCRLFEIGKMMDSQEFAGALRKIACVLLDNWGKNSLG